MSTPLNPWKEPPRGSSTRSETISTGGFPFTHLYGKVFSTIQKGHRGLAVPRLTRRATRKQTTKGPINGGLSDSTRCLENILLRYAARDHAA